MTYSPDHPSLSAAASGKHGRFLNRPGGLSVALLSLLTIFIALPLVSKLFAPPALTAHHAENFTYPSKWTHSGSLTLQNGSYKGDPYAEGLESRLQVELFAIALGNIDAAGGGDVAAILVSTLVSGSSYYDLHVLLKGQGKAVHAGSVYLGDRIQLQCLRIQKDRLMLQWIPHISQLDNNDHSRSLVTKFFAVRNGLLTEVEGD